MYIDAITYIIYIYTRHDTIHKLQKYTSSYHTTCQTFDVFSSNLPHFSSKTSGFPHCFTIGPQGIRVAPGHQQLGQQGGIACVSDGFFNNDLGVSENSGTPKSSILIRFSIINHPFWGVPLFLETPILG